MVSCVTLITLSSLVVRYDERRLERAAEPPTFGPALRKLHPAQDALVRAEIAEERLERAWPPSSRDNALIGLAFLGAPLIGLFAVWFHFFRTRSRGLWPPARWSLLGFFLGLAAVLAIMIGNAVVVLTLAYALGLPLDD